MNETEGNKRQMKKRLFHKMLLPVLIIAALQAVICLAMFFLSGTVNKIKTDKLNSFYEKVQNRSERVYSMLDSKSQYANHFKEVSEEDIQSVLRENQKTVEDLKTDEKLNEKIMLRLYEEFGKLIEESGSTGAFVVLNSFAKDSDSKYGFYLRTSVAGNADKKNCTVLRGTESLLGQLDVEADENWRSEFRITTDEQYNFYNKIYQLLAESDLDGNLSDGYWSPLFTMYGDDDNIITYTVPLLDGQGTFLGVLGLEIGEQLVLDEIPYKEVLNGSNASCYLVYRMKDSSRYQALVSSFPSGKNLADKDGYLQYSTYTGSENIYWMKEELKQDYIGAIVNMDMYAKDSPFYGEQWAVLGAESDQELLSNVNSLRIGVFIAIGVIIVLTAIQAWILCFLFVVYLRRITASIQESSLEDEIQEEIQLEEVDITEFQELSDSVKQLGQRATAAIKLADIIDMAEIPIGAIQYKEGDEYVFCTRSAADILEMHYVDRERQRITRSAYENELRALKKNLKPYEDEEDTFSMIDRNGNERWVSIKTKEREDQTLIAILDVTADVLKKQKIEYERDYDILTRLLNRTAFYARMTHLLKRGNLGVAATVMMDLDNLKYFNDSYGHEYGDLYIKQAATVLGTMSQHRAVVARMSGDEFLMFIYGYSDKEEIRTLVHDVHDRLKESYVTVPTGENIRLRASAGIAWYPDDATRMEELIKYADFAMYETKRSTKGNIKEFNRELYLKDALLLTGKEDLNTLLEEPDMVRYIFQPIVEVATGEIFSYEALMRPQIDSLRSPEDVMRLAKAQSKLYQVERMTWFEVLSEVERQRKPGDNYRIFINSVPNHALNDEDFQYLEEHFPEILDRVTIEIIESEKTNKACMEKKKSWVKEHKASIALDDYGAGYSNESTLLMINPDFVKLDMSIVSNIDKDEGRQKIVQGLLNYTSLHGIKVVAEGIDSYEEMSTLIRLGVDYMQGWYLARGQFEILDIPEELKKEIRQCAKEAAAEVPQQESDTDAGQ